MINYHILTIFPDIFSSFLKESILARAQQEQKVKINIYDIRDYTTDKHHKVDDTPYGGGAGMVMKIEPIYKALKKLRLDKLPHKKIVLLAARGQQFTQATAAAYQKIENLILICGRYEGIDQRVADYLCDEEISIGPYVLNGGEIPAMTIIEATFRLIPGALGNADSLTEESFVHKNKQLTKNYSREYPQYTKPEIFNDWKVPEVLLSGNHAQINEWRRQNSGSPSFLPSK
jgi:tRNA (guanine37-N1)-methyltransferase